MNENTINDAGLRAARRLAGWEIGDASWADLILEAYLDPAAAHLRMDAKEVPSQTGVMSGWPSEEWEDLDEEED